nr:immunoglobulin light chain junction region [Macaca mulatta]MOV34460.1 immunoglobulin light chain junction region [Macaca mulatta]MOV35223.1 immunoglobulin light chain junction region [Macaca mulatta]MOV35394.1 immunoglobulin light chain junction region [Macaca mulatta]MOW64301.1 immunoglobulin light chain junction region [Macaca mulatta]
CMQGIEYPFTF